MNGNTIVKKVGAIFFVLAGISLTPLYASDMSYSYAEGSYYIDHEADDVDGDGGFRIAGAFQATENIFALASYSKLDFDVPRGYHDIDVTYLKIGGGYIFPLNESWDINGTFSLIRAEADGARSKDDTSFGFSGGVRGMVIPTVEVRGRLVYENTDIYDGSDGFFLEAGGSFYIIPQVSVGLDITLGGDKSMRLGGRYSF
ncbi:MAG: outer membrane beta-barrel protein [Candidatus Thiodiazotropha sp.]|jgi:hypothetical protein